MPRYAYDRLTFLDNSFLIMEQPNAPMHIAGTAMFERRLADQAPTAAIDIDAIRAYVASRLHLIPRYRQRLSTLPLQQRPIWVDDTHFNIHYHVRHTALPRPGDERQLKRLAARIMAQHLDRAKPLWEIWIVEGLDGGDRFAMISKIHHCMVDGMSGVDLLNVLLQPEPSRRRSRKRRDWMPRPAPTAIELAGETVEHARPPAARRSASTVRRALSDAQDRAPTCARACAPLRDMFGTGIAHRLDDAAQPADRPAPPLRLAHDDAVAR